MKVYIAGPYTNGGIEQNVSNAINIADEVTQMGLAPFVPHLYHFWHLQHEHTWEFWMKLCLEWLPTCDCVLRLPGDSKGADIEVDLAKKMKMKVFYSLEEINIYLKES